VKADIEIAEHFATILRKF